MTGTKAIRSDEFPAEDIAPYKEILPSADGTYAVPVSNGAGCIGLQWDENRMLRRVAIEFPDAAAVPSAKSIQLQYWTGESEWQGNWQPADRRAGEGRKQPGLAARAGKRQVAARRKFAGSSPTRKSRSGSRASPRSRDRGGKRWTSASNRSPPASPRWRRIFCRWTNSVAEHGDRHLQRPIPRSDARSRLPSQVGRSRSRFC